jgi:transcriptional regulator with XRE-family HTH domain
MIGKKLNTLRKRMGLTLQQVSDSSGLSSAFLSQVEREQTSLSVSSLASIARALQVSPSFFFPPPQGNGLVVRGYDRHPFRMDDADVIYARLSGSYEGRSLEPLVATYPPGYLSELSSHQGEEFYYVLDGQLVVTLGDEEHALNGNDSMQFSSMNPHRLANRGETPAQVIAVNTPTLLE